MRQLLADFWVNLRSGFAFALFLRRGTADFRVGLDQLFTLLLFSLLLRIAVDHINHRPEPQFIHQAFATWGMSLLLFMLSAYLVSRLLRKSGDILTMLTLFFSTSLVFALLMIALRFGAEILYSLDPKLFTVASYGFLAWLLLVAARSALHAFAARRRAILVVLPLIVVVWQLPIQLGGWQHSFWQESYPPRPDRYAAYRKMDAEALLYAQPAMVQGALQRLVPQRRGIVDLYFVSFGSYAFQDVFMKEVRYAHRTMDARFDTGGHSLELVNNLQTREELPLATETNLRMVLKALGGMMDSEEDVLMLYLTSHGSRQHELSVDFWPLPLNDITPEKLKQLLDEAGIKWRVIVVSACYSGGFVETLQDDHTLVATAAAADRQSFGCSNENDFTYYGEALFHDGFGQGVPLLEAFPKARDTIAAREAKEELEPSRPQLYIGPLIEQKLADFVGREWVECKGAQPTDSPDAC